MTETVTSALPPARTRERYQNLWCAADMDLAWRLRKEGLSWGDVSVATRLSVRFMVPLLPKAMRGLTDLKEALPPADIVELASAFKDPEAMHEAWRELMRGKTKKEIVAKGLCTSLELARHLRDEWVYPEVSRRKWLAAYWCRIAEWENGYAAPYFGVSAMGGLLRPHYHDTRPGIVDQRHHTCYGRCCPTHVLGIIDPMGRGTRGEAPTTMQLTTARDLLATTDIAYKVVAAETGCDILDLFRMFPEYSRPMVRDRHRYQLHLQATRSGLPRRGGVPSSSEPDMRYVLDPWPLPDAHGRIGYLHYNVRTPLEI